MNDPRWVWFGRQIRYNARTISICAVAETIGASILGLYAAFNWGAAKWLLLYICIAPLLLLRTKASMNRALRWGGRAFDWLDGNLFEQPGKVGKTTVEERFGCLGILLSVSVGLISRPLYFAVMVPCVVAIKAGSVLFRNRKEWATALRRLPRNWANCCLQTDFSMLPEILPNASRVEDFGGYFSLSGLLKFWSLTGKGSFRVYFFLTIFPLLLGSVIFGYTYRIALKATALFWVLLIYFTRPVFRKKDTLTWRVNDTLRHPLNKVMRLWALAMIVAHLVVPFLLWQSYAAWTDWLLKEGAHVRPLLEYLFVTRLPAEGFPLDAWHVAGGVGAVLTWVLWKHAHDCEIARLSGMLDAATEVRGLNTVRALLYTRAVIITYTAICGMIAVFKSLHWVNLDVRWLP